MNHLKIAWLLDGDEQYGLKSMVTELIRALSNNENVKVVGIFANRTEFSEELSQYFNRTVYLNIGPTIQMRKRGGKRQLIRILLEARRLLHGLLKARRVIKEENVTILHSHYFHYHIVGLLAGKLAGVTAVWHWHGAYGFPGYIHFVFMLLAKWVGAIFCISKFVKKTFPAKLQNKCRVVYNGLDIVRFQNRLFEKGTFRKRYNIPENAYLIGTLGSWSPIKGASYFIQAIPQVLKQVPDTYFAVVGGPHRSDVHGKMLKKLITLSENLGIEEKIVFTNYLAEAARYIADFDIIVMPTIPYGRVPGEGFGLAALEAMMAEVATIVSDAGAGPEIVEHDKTGIVVPAKSADAIAQAIIVLLRDKNKRIELAKNGKAVAFERFDINLAASALYKVYSELENNSG